MRVSGSLHALNGFPQLPVSPACSHGPPAPLGNLAPLGPSGCLNGAELGRGEMSPYPTGDALGRGLRLGHGQRTALLQPKRIGTVTGSSDSLSPCVVPIGSPILSDGAVSPLPHVVEQGDVTPQPARLLAAAATVGGEIFIPIRLKM